jgi:hypothetical protein
MSPRIQRYLDKAEECEHMAAQAKSREAAILAKDAMQWRDLAKQAEHWEHVRGLMTESLRQFQSSRLPPIELSE